MAQLELERPEVEGEMLQGAVGEDGELDLASPLQQPQGTRAAGLQGARLWFASVGRKTQGSAQPHPLLAVWEPRAGRAAGHERPRLPPPRCRLCLLIGAQNRFVQHLLIPAPANPKNPPARTQSRETGWGDARAPPGRWEQQGRRWRGRARAVR